MSARAFHETPSSGVTAEFAARMQGMIPVLETKRLILRAPKIEDFDAFAEMLTPPRGKYYGNTQTREEAWGEFMQLTGTWLLRGYGAWVATHRDSAEVVGFFQIGAEPGDWEPELGWLVSQDAEGKGYATEAAKAVRSHAFGTLGLASLVSYVDFENKRSVRVAERLGATRDAEAEAWLPEHEACCVYRHSKEEVQ